MIPGQSLTGVAGSPAYVAPEVLSSNYREKVDIWSAGILFHALLSGSLPFQGKSLESIFEAIRNNKLDFHSGVWQSVSKLARDLVGKMLTRDITARFSADEVLGKHLLSVQIYCLVLEYPHKYITFSSPCFSCTKSSWKILPAPSFCTTNMFPP